MEVEVLQIWSKGMASSVFTPLTETVQTRKVSKNLAQQVLVIYSILFYSILFSKYQPLQPDKTALKQASKHDPIIYSNRSGRRMVNINRNTMQCIMFNPCVIVNHPVPINA